MNAKHNVSLLNLTPQCWYAIAVADNYHRAIFGQPITITSARDGHHMNQSKHYSGEAFDFRTRDLTTPQRQSLHTTLKADLAQLGFDVLDEITHIHIEYDPGPNSAPWVENVS